MSAGEGPVGPADEISLEELARRLGEVRVVDVRTPGEYDGTLGAPCDPRQGHVPGALHLELDLLFELPEQELRARLGVEAGGEIVAYCHSGARSAMAVEVLAGLGYRARNFRGSWHEWSRSDEPVEV